jgi:hypothetical protein
MMRQQCCRCDPVQLFQVDATSIVPLKRNEESLERVVLDSKTKRCEDKAWSASCVTLKKHPSGEKLFEDRMEMAIPGISGAKKAGPKMTLKENQTV